MYNKVTTGRHFLDKEDEKYDQIELATSLRTTCSYHFTSKFLQYL